MGVSVGTGVLVGWGTSVGWGAWVGWGVSPLISGLDNGSFCCVQNTIGRIGSPTDSVNSIYGLALQDFRLNQAPCTFKETLGIGVCIGDIRDHAIFYRQGYGNQPGEALCRCSVNAISQALVIVCGTSIGRNLWSLNWSGRRCLILCRSFCGSWCCRGAGSILCPGFGKGCLGRAQDSVGGIGGSADSIQSICTLLFQDLYLQGFPCFTEKLCCICIRIGNFLDLSIFDGNFYVNRAIKALCLTFIYAILVRNFRTSISLGWLFRWLWGRCWIFRCICSTGKSILYSLYDSIGGRRSPRSLHLHWDFVRKGFCSPPHLQRKNKSRFLPLHLKCLCC